MDHPLFYRLGVIYITVNRTRYRHITDLIDECPHASLSWKKYNPLLPNPVGSYQATQGLHDADRGSFPKGYQITGDENHSAQLKAFKRFKFEGDIGGEFDMVRKALVGSYINENLHDDYVDVIDGYRYVLDYSGPILPISPSSIPIPGTPGLTNLAPLGTRAIALVKPTNNVANLATDLAEARSEGLPSLLGVNLWKDRTNVARGAGAEYLNSEFGWKPLASDIRDSCYAAANAHSLLKHYEANSHKMVRRRYEFPVERTESTARVGTGHDTIPGNMSFPPAWISSNLHSGDLFCTTRTYRKVWFSGAFTYHLPVGYNSHNAIVSAAAKAGPLLGIELTPDVVWNATPWTWAIDWFSNMGDVVSITSDMATDGLVIKYGYVMEHTVTSYTYALASPSYVFNGKRRQHTPSLLIAYVERKRRTQATPFGFEIGWESFSPRQLAISAALGLTRIF
jgi:hypothetical protein